jgi:hypothetical protein
MKWMVSGDARPACVGRVEDATPAHGPRRMRAPSGHERLREGVTQREKVWRDRRALAG